MVNLLALMENEYKPEYPELLDPYMVDIEWESTDSEAWSGKVYQDNGDGGHFPLCGMENTGTGSHNNYYPIVFDQFPVFKNIALKCYPKALDPLDYACVYLEIREAYRQQDLDSQD